MINAVIFYRILQPSNYKSSGMGSKLSAMGVSGVGNRLVGGGMSGHRNSISFDRSGELMSNCFLIFISNFYIICICNSIVTPNFIYL